MRINWWWYLWGEKSYYHWMCLWNGLQLRIWSFPQVREHYTSQTNAVLCVCHTSLIHIWVHNCTWNMFFKWVFQVTLLTLLRSTLKMDALQYSLTQLCQWPISFHINAKSQYWATCRHTSCDVSNSGVMTFVPWNLHQYPKSFSLNIREFQLLLS